MLRGKLCWAKFMYFVFQNNTSIFVLAFRIEFLGDGTLRCLLLVKCSTKSYTFG